MLAYFHSKFVGIKVSLIKDFFLAPAMFSSYLTCCFSILFFMFVLKLILIVLFASSYFSFKFLPSNLYPLLCLFCLLLSPFFFFNSSAITVLLFRVIYKLVLN